jgi:hypothetical protein
MSPADFDHIAANLRQGPDLSPVLVDDCCINPFTSFA